VRIGRDSHAKVPGTCDSLKMGADGATLESVSQESAKSAMMRKSRHASSFKQSGQEGFMPAK
jgi:hypothetical protein